MGDDADGDEVEGPVEACSARSTAVCWTEQKCGWTGDREPRRRRDRGLGDLQHHRRRPPDAHPRDRFEVVNREGLVSTWTSEVAEPIQLDGDITPPEPWETGFKDTVIAYPGQVTRVRARFNTPGQFVWHCHIVEHEDNEMMRPYRIGRPRPVSAEVGEPEGVAPRVRRCGD